jgi:hypothetical protein
MKNNFNKRKKNIKIRIKLKKIKHEFWLKDKIENNKTLTKVSRKKIRNQKNKDRSKTNNIWQVVIDGLNWKHKTFYKMNKDENKKSKE